MLDKTKKSYQYNIYQFYINVLTNIQKHFSVISYPLVIRVMKHYKDDLLFLQTNFTMLRKMS